MQCSNLVCGSKAIRKASVFCQLKKTAGSRAPKVNLLLFKAVVRPHSDYSAQAKKASVCLQSQNSSPVRLRYLGYAQSFRVLDLCSLDRRRGKATFNIVKDLAEMVGSP